MSKTVERKFNSKQILNENISPMEGHIDEQQSKQIVQEKETKEDVLSVKEETQSSTLSHQQNMMSHAEKPIANNIPPSSNLQQPISNTVINQTLQGNSSFNVTSSSTTPLQSNQLQRSKSESNQQVNSYDFELDDQEGLSESVSSDPSLNHGSRQRETSDAIQSIVSVDSDASSPTPVKKEQITNSIENISALDQQYQIPETLQHVNSFDQEERKSETIQTTSSPDQHTHSEQVDQTSQINNTMETLSSSVKPDDISSIEKESSIRVLTSSATTRIFTFSNIKNYSK